MNKYILLSDVKQRKALINNEFKKMSHALNTKIKNPQMLVEMNLNIFKYF